MPPSPSSNRKARGGLIGRRIALAVYWAVTVWLAVASLVSIIPQVFWPAEARGEAPATVSSCDEALRTLHAELLTGVSDELAALDAPARPEAAAFLLAWDERYRSLDGPCGDRRAYPLLNQLRHALGTDLGRALGAAPLARRVRAALDEDEPRP